MTKISRSSTEVIEVDPHAPDVETIEVAAEVLRDDGIVAFPTETVYGLGARASSPVAVQKVFDAKGRPATNPLILHVADLDQARRLAATWPEAAQRLAEAFWPGPLTLVVRRSERVVDEVCAGLDTVAIRMPAHPVARALVEAVGDPLAAPSANRYTEVSPTTADHVLKGLSGRIDLVVDGGATEVGVESTLVSVVGEKPTVLRPGMIDRSQLSKVVELGGLGDEERVVDESEPRHSPGLSRRHYSPGVTLRLVESKEFIRLCEDEGQRGRVLVGGLGAPIDSDAAFVEMPPEPEEYARQLYSVLHRFDGDDVDEIIVEMPPEGQRWEAIRDRLRRAAD